MSITKSKDGRRFDEEFKREVADLASKPGAKQEQVARDLGVSPYSVSRWKKQYATPVASSSPGVSPQELARENRALRRENEVARPMRGHRLRATQKRRFRPRTTDRRHLCPIAPNHLAARQEPPARPSEVWQTDITYVATREGWLSLAGVLDACSRKIVGWAADDTMPTSLVARAFERAVALERPAPGWLHHSDRGSQYASDAYRERLRSHGVVASMSRAGHCYDNARMESFWATLKSESIQNRVFASPAEAKSEIFGYIEAFYNRTRLHGAPGFYSPVDFENSPS